jgi:hypothetical protein
MDGILTHGLSGDSDKKKAEPIARLLIQIAKNNSSRAKRKLYKLITDNFIVAFIDPILEIIIKSNIPPKPHLHAYSHWLVKEASDRGPVKLGISLLGIIHHPPNLPIIKLIGKHNEFTLFSAVAITNQLEDPTKDLWDLAQSVDGWGKIHLVERLTKYGNLSEDIKEWLIREGYKNYIMNEYLAKICAEAGNLVEVIQKPELDEELLISISEIIEALISGGPADDIRDYSDGPQVLDEYAQLMQKYAKSLQHLISLNMIFTFVSNDKEDWKKLEKFGWTEQLREKIKKNISPLLQQHRWREIIEAKKSTPDDIEFFLVDRAASILGIDLWYEYWKRLQQNPLSSSYWLKAVQSANRERMEKLVEFGEKTLPLEEIASGPLGKGPPLTENKIIGCILQDLGKFPNLGFPLIEAGIHSPNTRNRNLAVKALMIWGKENWPQDTKTLLKNTVKIEPDDIIRDSILSLLKSTTTD